MKDLLAIVLLCMLLGCQVEFRYKVDGKSHVIELNSPSEEASHD